MDSGADEYDCLSGCFINEHWPWPVRNPLWHNTPMSVVGDFLYVVKAFMESAEKCTQEWRCTHPLKNLHDSGKVTVGTEIPEISLLALNRV